MNRNEAFPAILVSTLAAHLAWASLDVMVEDVDQIQLFISGAESDVKDLRITCEENCLTVEQPSYGINLKNLKEYLSSPVVAACGGSYMVTSDLIDNQRWDEIIDLCRKSVEIVKEARNHA